MTETGANGLVVATFAERPDLLARVFESEIQSAVPEFMRHDPAGDLYYGDGQLGHYSFDAGTPITAGTWRAITASANVALTGQALVRL